MASPGQYQYTLIGTTLGLAVLDQALTDCVRLLPATTQTLSILQIRQQESASPSLSPGYRSGLSSFSARFSVLGNTWEYYCQLIHPAHQVSGLFKCQEREIVIDKFAVIFCNCIHCFDFMMTYTISLSKLDRCLVRRILKTDD